MTARHVLTIEPGTPGFSSLVGKIAHPDGSETVVYSDERARIIAQASAVIKQYHDAKATEPEVLEMDEFGEILRHPGHSVKVEERV